MKQVSNEFINLSKKVKMQDLKLIINDGELTVQEVHLMPVGMFDAMPLSKLRAAKKVITKELKYSFEGQLFKTIMQQIEITVKNASEIKEKNVNFKYGILINNEFEYLDMGEYYIKDVEDNKNKEELVVTGYDKMLNFMIPFKQSDLKLTYPCKMSQLVNRIGEVCGVELYSTDFYNSNLIVDEDFFTIQELTYRDVLEKIAQATLTTIFIKENKLYLCKIGDSVQTLDTSFLSNLVIKEKFGPVNALILGRGSVEDNIESIDQQSIDTNGRCEIRFDENEFIDSKREQVINEMLQQIKGLEYYSCESSNLGILWLDPCDVITVKNRENSEYKTIYLKANVTINTGIKGEMEADIPDIITTEYKVTTKEEKKTLKVERLAKKNEGLIKDIIEENTKTANKLSEHTQTIDSMKDTLSSQETQIETIETKADNAQISANNAQTTANTANTNAQNAQNTANANTTKITTNTTKIAEVEKTVEGITQTVSSVEEKVETIENTANTAKTTADNTKNNLATNYYTKTEAENKITQTAESTISEVSKTYSTKTETATAKQQAINSANTNTNTKLKDYTKIAELGTKIEQNWEHVKVAWNQISEFIQMEILNENASLAFRKDTNNLLMALDKLGQHFYDSSGKVFGEMGVKTVDNQNYVAFSVPSNYNKQIQDGMAWGITTSTDGKFHPILFIKNFAMGNQQSDDTYGQLILNACDLVFGGMETGIISGNIKMYGNAFSGITFEDKESGNVLLDILPGGILSGISTGQISFLNGKFSCYDNSGGSFTFNFGGDVPIMITDEGYLKFGGTSGSLDRNGNVTCVKVYQTSKKENKKNFEKLENALDIIKRTDIYKYNMKTDKDNTKKSIGFVIGNKYNYSKEITSNNNDGVDIYSFVSVCCKAIQEQQEQIEELKEKDKQKDEIIQNLIKRIEKLEGGSHE